LYDIHKDTDDLLGEHEASTSGGMLVGFPPAQEETARASGAQMWGLGRSCAKGVGAPSAKESSRSHSAASAVSRSERSIASARPSSDHGYRLGGAPSARCTSCAYEGVQLERAGEAHQRMTLIQLGELEQRRVEVASSASARATGQPS
jgi:hypothetical protein